MFKSRKSHRHHPFDKAAPRVRRPRSRHLAIEQVENRLMLSGTDLDTSTFNIDFLGADYAVISAFDSRPSVASFAGTSAAISVLDIPITRATLVGASDYALSLSGAPEVGWNYLSDQLTSVNVVATGWLTNIVRNSDSGSGLFTTDLAPVFVSGTGMTLHSSLPGLDLGTSHGTAVAGLIATSNANYTASPGVAPDLYNEIQYRLYRAVGDSLAFKADGFVNSSRDTISVGGAYQDDPSGSYQFFSDARTLTAAPTGSPGTLRVGNMGYSGAGVVVAVVGSGIQGYHPDVYNYSSNNFSNYSSGLIVSGEAAGLPKADLNQTHVADQEQLVARGGDGNLDVVVTHRFAGAGGVPHSEILLSSPSATDHTLIVSAAGGPAEGGMIPIQDIVDELASTTIVAAAGNQVVPDRATAEITGELTRVAVMELIQGEADPAAPQPTADHISLLATNGVARRDSERNAAEWAVKVFAEQAGLATSLIAPVNPDYLVATANAASDAFAAVVGTDVIGRLSDSARSEAFSQWGNDESNNSRVAAADEQSSRGLDATPILLVLACEPVVAAKKKRQQRDPNRQPATSNSRPTDAC